VLGLVLEGHNGGFVSQLAGTQEGTIPDAANALPTGITGLVHVAEPTITPTPVPAFKDKHQDSTADT